MIYTDTICAVRLVRRYHLCSDLKMHNMSKFIASYNMSLTLPSLSTVAGSAMLMTTCMLITNNSSIYCHYMTQKQRISIWASLGNLGETHFM